MMLVGSIVVVLGVAAERSGYPSFKYLLLGIGCFFLGLFVWDRLRKKRRSTRFSLFRKRKREEKEDRRDPWEDGYDD